jgi:MFS family permease
VSSLTRGHRVTAHRTRDFAAIGAGYSLLAAGLTSTTALASLRKTVPMSETVTSLHGSFFGWGLIGLVLAASLLRRVKRSTIFLTGVVMIGCGAPLFALATRPLISLTGAALFGFGSAGLVLTMPAIVAQRFPTNRSVVFAQLNAVPVVVGMSLPLSLLIFDRMNWSWRIPVLIASPTIALLTLVISLPLIRIGAFDSVTDDTEHLSTKQLLADHHVRTRFILQVVTIGLEFGFGSWLVVYLRDVGNLSAGMAPIGAVAWGVGMLFVRVSTPKIQPVLGHKLEALAFTFFAAAAVVLTLTRTPLVLILAIVAAGISIGGLYALGVDRIYRTAHAAGFHDDDAISTLAALASGLAITVGPLAIGTLADIFTLRQAMIAPAIGGIVCALLAIRKWRGEAGLLGTQALPPKIHTSGLL